MAPQLNKQTIRVNSWHELERDTQPVINLLKFLYRNIYSPRWGHISLV